MFILQSGTLEVSIAGRKAAVIEQPGTVIGEMALLLGEKRTATIKPVNTAVLDENYERRAQAERGQGRRDSVCCSSLTGEEALLQYNQTARYQRKSR